MRDSSGKEQGPHKEYNYFSEDDWVECSGNYLDGIREGKWVYYYSTGVFVYETLFLKGEEEGEEIKIHTITQI